MKQPQTIRVRSQLKLTQEKANVPLSIRMKEGQNKQIDIVVSSTQYSHYRHLSLPKLNSITHSHKSSLTELGKSLIPNFHQIVAEESKIIKQRLNEYTQIMTMENSLNLEAPIIPNSEICERLKEQGAQLDMLLSRNNPICTLLPYKKERVFISNVSKYSAKINCKEMKIPLIMNINLKQGINCTYIYFSYNIERPNDKNNDKTVLLNKPYIITTFTEEPQRGSQFYHKFIYISIQTEDYCEIDFECSFGRGN